MSSQYLSPGSPYLDQGVGSHGPTPICGATARHCVLHEDIGALTELHQEGTGISYALEYAAQMGKHQVTQRLLMMGVPVTRKAIQAAARRRGPGMDLLLVGIRPEDKPKACSVAMTFRMVAGDFQKAYEMLDAGVVPDLYFISGAYSGMKAHCKPFETAFQDAIDRYLPRVPLEVLEQSHLEFVVEHGRPFHIERLLERLQQPVAFLMPFALGSTSDEGINRLREFGCPIDDVAFGIITSNMSWNCKSRIYPLMHHLCGFVNTDGNAGTISATHVEPIIDALMSQKGTLIRTGFFPGGEIENHLVTMFSLLAPCMKVEDRGQLHSILDRWQNGRPESIALEAHVLAQIHNIIDQVALNIPDLSPVSGPNL